MDIQLILILIAIGTVIVIYVVARERINLRKAAGGEDQERLRKVVAQALPGENGYQVAYGHYEKVEHYGRKTITTYYCYALAFEVSRFWVIPLRFDKELILSGEPVLITGDMLGVVDINITNDKEGKARLVECALYDKAGESFLNCVVEVNNTKKDGYHHVNIIQKQECDWFGRMLGSMAAQVNRDNAGLQAHTHTVQASTRKAWTYGTFGAVFSIFFPPVGLALSIIGLRHAKKSWNGKRSKAALVLCWVALVSSIIFTLMLILLFLGGLGG